MQSAHIVGWGTALPEKIVTNHDLEATLDTSDTWIRERSGIGARHVGGTTTGLAVEAGAAAIERAGLTPDQIDLIILATTTPDQMMPGSAAGVQHGLGLRCGAFDVNAACSGFVYALVTGHQLALGGLERVLVIGSETLSRVTDWEDRGTAVLFGDGAGAVVLERREADRPDLLGWDLGSDGSLGPLLYIEHGDCIRMNGKEVFRQAVRVMVSSSQRSMAMAGVTADDIKLVVPHQANIRIVDSAFKKLGIPMERASMVLEHTGNTSAASIPLALAHAADNGRLEPGDLALLVGFGSGMTWASAIVRWDPERTPTTQGAPR